MKLNNKNNITKIKQKVGKVIHTTSNIRYF